MRANQQDPNILETQMLIPTFAYHLQQHVASRPAVNLGRLKKSAKTGQLADLAHKLNQAKSLLGLDQMTAGTTESFKATFAASAGTNRAGVQPGHFDSATLLRETKALCNKIFDRLVQSKQSEANLKVLAVALGRDMPAKAPQPPTRHRAPSVVKLRIPRAAAAGTAPELPARDPATDEDIQVAFRAVAELQQFVNGFKQLPAHITATVHQQIRDFQATLATTGVTTDVIEEVTAAAKQAQSDFNGAATLAITHGLSARRPTQLGGAGIGTRFAPASHPPAAAAAGAGAAETPAAPVAAASSAPPPLPARTARLRSPLTGTAAAGNDRTHALQTAIATLAEFDLAPFQADKATHRALQTLQRNLQVAQTMLAHGAETAEQMSLLQDTILGQVLNAIRDALKATPAQQADSVHALIRSQLQRANILPVIAQFYQEEAQLDKTEDTPENYQAHHIAVAGTDAATGTASQARVDFGGYARAVVTCKNMQTISNQLGIELPAAATATLSSNLAAISTAWSAKPQLASHRADRRARAESAPPPLPPITARLSSIRFTTAPAAMATAKEVKAALAKLQQTLNGVSKPGQIDPDIYMKAAGELGKLNAELYGGEIDSPQPTSVLDRINETHKSLMKDIAAYLQQQSSRVRLGQAC